MGVIILFIVAAAIAIIGLVVAGRFLYTAWSDIRLGRNRRLGPDRRRGTLPVPMERRRRDRRS
jgi:hypothetical protein